MVVCQTRNTKWIELVVNSQLGGSKSTKGLTLLKPQCPPLTCPSFSAVAANTDATDGYHKIGSTVELTCTVQSKTDPSTCTWSKTGDDAFSESGTLRFGNISCGNFQDT